MMITIVRIGSFLIACGVLIGSVFFVDADHELKMAYSAYRHFDMDQAMRHARRAVVAAGEKKKVALSALGLEVKVAEKSHHEGWMLGALDRMIDLSPECATCYLKRGDLFYAQGAYQKAVGDFSQGLRRAQGVSDKKRAYFSARRGLAYFALDTKDKAASDAGTALEMDPKSPLAHFLKSKVLRSLGDGKGAIKEATIAYDLGKYKKGFFNSPEGERWLKYYSKVLLGR